MKKLLICVLCLFIVLLCSGALAEEGHQHVWSAYSVITEPTCTSEGLEVRICTLCGASEQEVLSKKDHAYGEWTYYSDSHHARYCSECGALDREEHDRAITRTITAAQNNRLGKKSMTCSKCSYNYTRLYSVYDALYSQEGTDVLENGSAYVKVNTVTLGQGSEKTLTLYSDSAVSVYASTNLKLEIYANASSGEYCGVYVTSGKALFTVDGTEASLEFIKLASAASADIVFKSDYGKLLIASADSQMEQVTFTSLASGRKCLVVTKSRLDGSKLEGSMKLYACPTSRLSMLSSGLAPAEGTVVTEASWSYSVRTLGLRLSASKGDMSVFSSGKQLLAGETEGTLSEKDILWGWYITLEDAEGGLSYTSPTYTQEGTMLDAEPECAMDTSVLDAGSTPAPTAQPDDNIDKPTDAPASDPTPAPTEDVSVPKTITSGQVMSAAYAGSPTVNVHYEGSTYEVKLTNLPSNLTFLRIEFIQQYNYGGLRMLNSYSSEGVFSVKNVSGTISAAALFQDRQGNVTRVSAGTFEFIAE
ncbi:MAG: PT domain-containing protein [Clostridia bacterium]|nr:PT domain-containing protein [Clostridia bacterium]